MIIKKFEKQVEKFSGKLAVITENRQLTFCELNRCANRVAQEILEYDTIPGKSSEPAAAALLFQHSAAMIIGVIAALKAGKIYLPLDINYPEKRLIYMLEDSQARLVLTDNTNLDLAENLVKNLSNNIRIINVDTLEDEAPQAGENITREPSGSRLAYILYTSGSTGKPKRVVQNHENVLYYIRNWIQRFSLGPSDRMTLFTAFSHDGAGQDIFGALLSGATLYPYNILNRPTIAGLSQWLTREKITIWHSVPTLYRYFVHTLKHHKTGKGLFPDLRFILLGGERIRQHDLQMFRRFFPHCQLANVYGQTESSVDSIWIVKPTDTFHRVLLGDPLDKTRIFLKDVDGEIVDDLGTGEIYISCPHLALGYWKDNENTARVFLRDPDMGLVYCTGDLGRLLGDGSIEFIGRKDSQLKIRGFRVETAEIENLLLKYEGIKEAVAAARIDEKEDAQLHLCAYIVPEPSLIKPGTGPVFPVSALRSYLAAELPEYMIPSYFVEIETLPLTPNGKVDRKALPPHEPLRPRLAVTFVAPQTSLEKTVSAVWQEVLRLDKVGIDDNFFDLGGTSFDILKIISHLHEVLHMDIPVVSLFRHPTIRLFSEYLQQEKTGAANHLEEMTWYTRRNRSRRKLREASLEIAVIGMAGSFPGSRNIDEFWENLKNGVESITFFNTQQLATWGVRQELLENPGYVKANGILDDFEYFDAAFFNYSPAEAEMMDPQLRILHECSWEALENAAYNPDDYEGLIGLYAGNSPNHYWITLTYLNQRNSADTLFLNNNYTTKVSYKLNLQGPSTVVQSACSTSLLALHLACQGLLNKECDIALAGGISIGLPAKAGYLYQEGMILSPDGHCRVFAHNASGTIFGDGVGIVVLKRLAEAAADGDNISAVIKATAANNDGKRKVGVTAPSVEGQAEVIRAALELANLQPQHISYVETHGTGTILGDIVEIEALKLAFNTTQRGYCRIGSVKTNIGHLNSAAGVAGFIKTVLALKHRLIPPSLHFNAPNPGIDFANSPFYVSTGLEEWKRGLSPLRAGVSSFGLGGTNVHVILEEPPGISESVGQWVSESVRKSSEGTRGLAPLSNRQHQLILLSARTRTALEQMTQNLINHLHRHPDIHLPDTAYTLQVGRKAFKYRRMALCSHLDELPALSSSPIFAAPEGKKPVIFMVPGMGSHYVNMGWELYQTFPLFRREMDRCFEILKPLIDYDIKDILYPHSDCKDGFDCRGGSQDSPSPGNSPLERGAPQGRGVLPDINQTEIAQVVIFIFEYALAKLLMALGIEPYAMIGYSFGEYAAACISGVFSLEEALEMIVLRGRLLQTLPNGAMLSVPAGVEEVKPQLTLFEGLAIAVDNGSSCIVSGPAHEIDAFEKQMKEKRYLCMGLNVLHALHSPMMAPASEKFAGALGNFTFHKPGIPYVSNVTGTWITVEDALDPGYWGIHLTRTVRFADGMQELLTIPGAVFIEVGPGRDLSTLIQRYIDENQDRHTVDLIRAQSKEISDRSYFLDKIGRLWRYGIHLNWSALHGREKRRRVPLPAYPFERERFWLEGDPLKISQGTGIEKELAGKQPNIAVWFYVPSWKPRQLPQTKAAPAEEKFHWLLFMDSSGIGARLQWKLEQEGHQVSVARPGDQWADSGTGIYTLCPTLQADYDTLLKKCCSPGKVPRRIVHLWNVAGPSPAPVERELELGYYSLINLAQAIGKTNIKDEIELTAVTDGMQGIRGDDLQYPQKATMLGPLRVISREYLNIRCRSIDIEIPSPGMEDETVMEQLLTELLAGITDSEAVYRVNRRWVRTFEPRPLFRTGREASRLKQEGVYLITGGLGGLGLELARYLAKTVKARLVLTGRHPLPPRHQWQELLDSSDAGEDIITKIRKVQELEALGAKVLVFSADAAERQEMQEVITRSREQFGKIAGVIHAAGVPDGTIIQRRNPEMSQRILGPKVTGTLILDELLKDQPLDFLILFSSTVAVTALGGQVAYCAANVFLDHFARYKSARDGGFCVSINWDAWKQVGMAAKAINKIAASPREIQVKHPLFDKCQKHEPDREVWISYLQANRDWVLEEHRILGKATLPGTAYLEMARAAFEAHQKVETVELSDIYFLTPLTLEEDECKEVRTLFQKYGRNYRFSIISRLVSGQDQWVEHAKGNAAAVKNDTTGTYDIRRLKEICGGKEKVSPAAGRKNQRGAMTFGPRWDNLCWRKGNKNRGLAELQLPEAFVEEAKAYWLHPALLDVATTFLRPLVQKEGAYMPFYYKRLSLKGSIPGKIICFARSLDRDSHKSQKETLKFDVTIMDEQGMELAEIEEFTLKRVHVNVGEARKITAASPRSFSYYLSGSPGEKSENVIHGMEQGREEDLEGPLKDAILPGEGIEAFLRILSAEQLHQVIVSTTSLDARLQQLERLTEEFHRQGFLEEELSSLPQHPRPELSTPYTPPVTGLEHILVKIWQQLLGIDAVGVQDDFFELGGDSLKAITFARRIYQELNIEVPLSVFFDKLTIKELAQYFEENNGIHQFYSIPAVEKKEYYALSSAQKRLYILQKMEPGSTGYNLTSVIELEGKLNKRRLETVMGELINRHESLRTSFHMIDGEPVQKIHHQVEFGIEYYDMKEVEEGKQKTEKIRQRAEDISGTNLSSVIRHLSSGFIRPFDLSRAPLMRVGLLSQAETRCLLILDMHHAIYDGVSIQLFFEEFMDLYRKRKHPTLRIQYKDYAEWQKNQRNTELIKKQQDYWLKIFPDDIPVLDLPMDFPRPAAQSFEGNRLKFTLQQRETHCLKKVAKEQGATLFMVLLAIINILLMKLSGQEDIVVGTPVTERKHLDLEKIIGIFVSTVALRNKPLAGKKFAEFLENLKVNTLNSFDNQGYPFEDLVEKVEARRDASRNPLFDIMFVMHNYEMAAPGKQELEIEGLKIRKNEYDPSTSRFDITFNALELNHTLAFTIEYCTKLFKVETIERFVGYFKKIVFSLGNLDERKLADIDIIDHNEKNRLLYTFNNTAAAYPQVKNFQQLFTEQAEKKPDHIALVGGRPTQEKHKKNSNRSSLSPMSYVSYKKLNEESQQLAMKLHEKGAKPSTIVGILVERTVHMLVGLLAILKTGAAYLPLDPEYPPERIKYILEKSDTGMLLIQNNLFDNGKELMPRAEIIDILDHKVDLTGEKTGQLKGEVSPTDPVYVIYTSGSTGNPKGVMVKHQNVVNFIIGMVSIIDFSPGKVILAVTTIAFDIFFLEALLPLTRGMQVVMAVEKEQKDPDLLEKTILKNQVDMIQFTPSRLQLLLNLGNNLQGLAGVKELMVGGEAFPAPLLGKVQELFQGKIYNMYGPTETTIWSAVKELTHTDPAKITIGTPIANTRLYIFDRNKHPQPLEVNGELWIGGDGVASGYLNNVELTVEKFCLQRSGATLFEGTRGLAPLSILATRNPQPATALIKLEGTGKNHMQSCNHASMPSPHHPITPIPHTPHSPHSPIYRTGDLARWLSNGEIEFLGRLDYQVKIRGFRVDVEEIEEQLLRHERIKEAVVDMKTGPSGEQFLCAYLILHEADLPDALNIPELREMLLGKLPHYMLPAYFVPLKKMPLTPNGKIDRRALPEPELSRSHLEAGATFVAPGTDREKIIANIWKEILHLDEVGIHDNFFDLGGNSMHVIQLNWKLKENFGKEIPIELMFRNLSISFIDQYLVESTLEDKAEHEEKQIEAMDTERKTFKDTIGRLTGE
ncbi:MAG: amino acid adenylation domain-containing protein [Candidatus Aminicenantes bacterium]|jgi:amino acid adenylation domain-containing protein